MRCRYLPIFHLDINKAKLYIYFFELITKYFGQSFCIYVHFMGKICFESPNVVLI